MPFQQIGQALPAFLQRLLPYVLSRDCQEIECDHHGVAAGHRRGYYHDNGEDALIMWLEPEHNSAGSSAIASGAGGLRR